MSDPPEMKCEKKRKRGTPDSYIVTVEFTLTYKTQSKRKSKLSVNKKSAFTGVLL